MSATGVSFPTDTCDEPSAVTSSGTDVDEFQSALNAGPPYPPDVEFLLAKMISETKPVSLGRPFPMPDRFRVITPLPTPHSTPGTESSSYLSSVCSTPATDSSASSRWASDVASMTARFAAKRAAVRKAREELTWEKDSYLLLHNGTETYKVLGTLGVGASGRVMSARYNGWDVAVKVIHKHMVYPSTSGRQKFLEELKAMKRVTEADLSFVCPLLSAWADGDNIYFVMPCLRETMLQRINRLPLTRQEVRLYSAEMIHGLSNLHSAGIIHRDIKLENILFDVHGHVVFTDLGCSRIVNPEDNETIQDVRMYDNEGTASYWAPEMVSSPGEHGYGWEVDIWALGMVIYEMATNTTVPFYSGKSPYGIQYEMMLYDVPVERILDQGLQNLLRRMLARDPKRRRSAEQFKAHPFFHRMLDWKSVVSKNYEVGKPGNAIVDDTDSGMRFMTSCSERDERYPDLQFTDIGEVVPKSAAMKNFEEDEAAPDAFKFSLNVKDFEELICEFSEWEGEVFKSRYRFQNFPRVNIYTKWGFDY